MIDVYYPQLQSSTLLMPSNNLTVHPLVFTLILTIVTSRAWLTAALGLFELVAARRAGFLSDTSLEETFSLFY